MEGEYLAAGYSEGNIALFEVKTQRLIAEIKDIHLEEVQSIKFLSIDTPITFVTADKVGTMFKVSVSKTLMIYSVKTEVIMKKPFKDFSCFASLQPIKGMPKEVSTWYIHNIIGFANTELINVAMLGSGARKLWTIKRDDFAKGMIDPNSFWHLDWGYGLTPEISRDKQKWLLAIAWGRMLQIMILENPDKDGSPGIKFDGYYMWESNIDGIYFISDSILMILVNKKEIRVLYIPYFLPGSIWKDGIKIKTEEDSKAINSRYKDQNINKQSFGETKLIEWSKKSEFEIGHTLLDGDIISSNINEKQNFQNSISVSANSVMVLGNSKVLSVKLFNWEEFLKFIQKQWDWLVWLKVALDIYYGEIKGYSGVPYAKEARENSLKPKMKSFLSEGIYSMIKNYKSNRLYHEIHADYQADNIAIKASVEFWKIINSFPFLFNEIFSLFHKEGLESRFIENLEPFIFADYFKNETMPDVLLSKIWDYYMNSGKYHTFEKIVTKLNFNEFTSINQLEKEWKEKMLINALIHLRVTPLKTNDSKACLEILVSMYNKMKQGKKSKNFDSVQEIILQDEASRYLIESSYEYWGLKLMLIIKWFINGEKYPSGKLNKNICNTFLSECIEFLMRKEEAIDLIKLNSKLFFFVVSELYVNSTIVEKVLELNKTLDQFGKVFIEVSHSRMIEKLFERVSQIQNDHYVLYEYSYFVVKAASSSVLKDNAKNLANRVYSCIMKVMDDLIEYVKTQTSPDFQNQANSKYHYFGPVEVDFNSMEDEISKILAFYISKVEESQVDELINRANILKFDKANILLHEIKQEFEEWVNIYLKSPRVKSEEVFKWLSKIYQRKQTKKERRIEDLKLKLKSIIEELISINPIDTGYMVDQWMEGEQKELINKLDRNPKLQLLYLESYLLERENEIIQILHDSSKSIKTSKDADFYKALLMKHIELLSKANTPKLIEVVKKEYYSVDCLKSIVESSSLMHKEAQAYLLKRAEMYENSLKIFLDLWKQVDEKSIRYGIHHSWNLPPSDTYYINFLDTFNEVIEILEKSSIRPDYQKLKSEMWYISLTTLFKIRDSFSLVPGSKQNNARDFISTKIFDLMEVMSEYIDFEDILTILLTIDSETDFSHSKSWFQKMYISKNDQEILLISAKNLIHDQNTLIIDTLIERNNYGLIGSKDSQSCSLWGLILGNQGNESSFILSMWNHNFHTKWYFDELKQRKLTEGKIDGELKVECPICIKHNIELEEGDIRSSVKKNKKSKKNQKLKKDIGSTDQILTSKMVEEKLNDHPLFGKSKTLTKNKEEGEQIDLSGEALYKERLHCYEENFAATQTYYVFE